MLPSMQKKFVQLSHDLEKSDKLKDIFAKNSRLGHDLPTSVNGRMISRK